MEAASKNKLVLPTWTALAIWRCEVTGQLSDGTWENSVPHDHWKFWSRVEATVGDKPGVVMGHNNWRGPTRTVYNIVNLANMKWNKDELARMGEDDPYILRGRMLAYGRMAKAIATLAAGVCKDGFDAETIKAAEYMPPKLYQFNACKAAGIWEHDFVAKYMEHVGESLAAEFYRTVYTVDELKADLEAISSAMRAPTTREDSPTNQSAGAGVAAV